MKEFPILFSGEMVRAILAGCKTQTRRVIKLPPAPMHLGAWEPSTVGGPGCFRIINGQRNYDVPEIAVIWHTRTGKIITCPYGDVGDRLWVREAWLLDSDLPVYRADDPSWPGENPKWKPSIHMPRWASRILLEIVSVRIERLRDIGEAAAQAEGAGLSFESSTGQIISPPSYRNGFIKLWNDINSPRGFGWWKNPWVWVIEFKRVGDKN